MNNVRKRPTAGFTLIEVLIVVTIMAILAATIVPQFTTSSEEAKQSQLDFNLNMMRSQVQLYRLEHNGVYPTTLSLLTKKTNAEGTEDSGGAFGPYIAGGVLPKNPITDDSSESVSTDGATKTGGGWLYDASTGSIWADGPSS